MVEEVDTEDKFVGAWKLQQEPSKALGPLVGLDYYKIDRKETKPWRQSQKQNTQATL